MQDVFITKIHIDKVRHIENVDIELAKEKRMHLILTGKNGSGKTSLLEAMRMNVIQKQQISYVQIDIDTREKYYNETVMKNPGVEISYSQEVSDYIDIIFVYIAAERSKLNVPKTIEPINNEEKTLITQNKSRDFLKYLIHLDYRLYGEKTDNNTNLAGHLEKWFENFRMALCDIYACPELKLLRDTKNLMFRIEMPGREPFGLHEMADGYSAFLEIYMELLIRFENENGEVDYNKSAIVMIDEIETHLHVELQKRVLPFLTKMFPMVQFIVTTHSPFVVTSLENAIVYDLEKNERLDTPFFYSYDTVVESFLDTSMYSNELKRYFKRYEELCFKKRTAEENEEFLQAKAELEIKSIPSTELYIAFQDLERRRKAVYNGTPD
jgi:predicted ATP-binding protein involved in virulence